MNLLLILGIFSGIGNVIECLFSGILALICLIPVGIICVVAGYIRKGNGIPDLYVLVGLNYFLIKKIVTKMDLLLFGFIHTIFQLSIGQLQR